MDEQPSIGHVQTPRSSGIRHCRIVDDPAAPNGGSDCLTVAVRGVFGVVLTIAGGRIVPLRGVMGVVPSTTVVVAVDSGLSVVLTDKEVVTAEQSSSPLSIESIDETVVSSASSPDASLLLRVCRRFGLRSAS